MKAIRLSFVLRSFLCLAALTAAPLAMAAPASNQILHYTQPDGTAFDARLFGDEFFSYYTDTAGHPLRYDYDTKWWTYALPADEGVGASSGLRVGIDPPPAVSVVTKPTAEVEAEKTRTYTKSVPTPKLSKGKAVTANPKVAMFLTTFSDRVANTDPSKPIHQPAAFESLFFDTSDPSALTAANLFKQMSYGAHNLSSGPSGIQGWVTAPKTHDYYGNGIGPVDPVSGRENAATVAELARWRAQTADASFDFGPYDTDNDGKVDLICIVYQGTSQANGGSPSDIWPIRHSFTPFTTNDTNAEGETVTVSDYIIIPELSSPPTGTGTPPITTIGLFCHEYGHGIGWPDLYDGDGNNPRTTRGLGNWCLMANGCYNTTPGGASGNAPCWANPLMRAQVGWVAPSYSPLNRRGFRFPDAKTENVVAKIWDTVPIGEYFLVENRQRTGFDQGLPGSGLLIWHIDENVNNNNNPWWYISPSDQMTNIGHHRVALLQADGQFNMEKNVDSGDAGDPYVKGKTLTSTTIPNSRAYNFPLTTTGQGRLTDVVVSGISDNGAVMNADLLVNADKQLPTVTLADPQNGLNYTVVTTFSGTASDNVSVSAVYVALQRTSPSGDTWFNWTNNTWETGAYDHTKHRKTATGTTSWSTTITAGYMTEGSYIFYALATDPNGNETEFKYNRFNIVQDPNGPAIDFQIPTANQNFPTGSVPNFQGTVSNVTGNFHEEFALKSEDGANAGKFYNWTTKTFSPVNEFTAANVYNDTGTNWVVNMTAFPIPDGRYTFFGKVVNFDLRESGWKSRVFRVGQPISVAIASPGHNSGVKSLQTITGTYVEPSGSGAQGGGVELTLVNGSGQYWNGSQWTGVQSFVTAPIAFGSWSYEGLPSSLSDGVYTLSASLTNNAGESTTSTTGVNQITFRVDNGPPVGAITSPGNGITITTKTLPSFIGTASDSGGIGYVNCFLRRNRDNAYWTGSSWTFDAHGDGQPPVAFLSGSYNAGNGTWSCASTLPVPGSTMENGSYNFIMITGDLAGNYIQRDAAITLNYHETYTWTGGTMRDSDPGNNTNSWSHPGNWSPYGVPGSGDIAIINNGDVVNTPVSRTLYGLELGAGALEFANSADNTVTTTNASKWTGGVLNGVWNNQGSLELSGGATKLIGHTCVMNNYGTATWAGPGTIQGYQNSTWNNKPGSTFTMTTDGDVFSNYQLGNVFNNEAGASFIKSTGGSAADAWSFIDEWTVNNAGQISSQQGTIHFNTTLNLNSGSTLAGAGRVLLNGTTNLATALTSTGNPELVGTLNGTIATSGYSGTNPWVWSSGSINGSFTLAAGSTFDFTTGATKLLGHTAFFHNYGRFNWRQGLLQGYQNSTFNNESGATFDMVTDGDVFSNYQTGNVFNNKAGSLFTKSGKSVTPDAVSFVDEWRFNNLGTIRSNTGTLQFHTELNLGAGGTISRIGSTLALIRSTHYLVLTGTTTISNITFESAGDWHGNVTVGTAGNGTLATTAGGVFNWTAGYAHNTVNITAGSTFLISGNATKTIGLGGVLNNNGNATWTGGNFEGYQNSTFANLPGATFTSTTDADFVNYQGGNQFANSAGATFTKTGGTENNRFDWAFNNNGVVTGSAGAVTFNNGGTSSGTFTPVTGGLVQFTSGTHSLITTAKFEGTGKIQVLGGAVTAINTVNNSATATTLEIAGGAINSAPAGSFNALGTINWTSGYIGGTFNVKSGSAFNISGVATKQIENGGIINNSGNASWTAPGVIQGYQNSTWNNKSGGTFTMTTDGDVFSNYQLGNVFNNESGASFIKSTGGSAAEAWSYIDEWTVNNAGQISSQQGTLHFNTALNLNAGSTLAGAGRVLLNGTTNLATTLNSTGNPELVATLNGTIATAGFSGTQPFVWSSGSINGNFTLAAGSTLDFTTGATKVLGHTSFFHNLGRFNWRQGLLQGYQNSTFNNESGATFDMFTDGDVFSNYQLGNVFNNKGGALFIKSGKSATPDLSSYIDEWTFNNLGAIRSDNGTLHFHTALNLGNGSSILRNGALAARVRSTHYFVLTGTTTVNNITFESFGDFHGNLDPGTSGNGTIATVIGGVFNWTAGYAHNTVTIAPGSTVTLTGGDTKTVGNGGNFRNGGHATWSGGAIQGYQNSTFTNLAGATFVAATDADFINYQNGNQFVNHGTFQIGSPIGVTHMNWSFIQSATGLLDIQLGGTNPATPQFDQLHIGGTATLGGTLRVGLTNSFIPVPDTTFLVLGFPGRSGSFASVQCPGLIMDAQHNGGNVTLIAKDHPETNKEWKQYFFPDPLAAEAQPMADPDNDGMPNLLEYAFGMDPHNGSKAPTTALATVDSLGGKSVIVSGTRYGSIAFDRPYGTAALTDITYAVERSTTLLTPSWSGTGVIQHSLVPTPAGTMCTETWRSTTPTSSARVEFLRVRVTLNTP